MEKYTEPKGKRMGKDISCKWKGKKCGSSTYTDKIHLKSKAIIRDKEEHCIMIKGTIQQENITLINIFASNTRAPKYVKQILMDIKGEIDRNTVILRDFNTPLT